MIPAQVQQRATVLRDTDNIAPVEACEGRISATAPNIPWLDIFDRYIGTLCMGDVHRIARQTRCTLLLNVSRKGTFVGGQ